MRSVLLSRAAVLIHSIMTFLAFPVRLRQRHPSDNFIIHKIIVDFIRIKMSVFPPSLRDNVTIIFFVIFAVNIHPVPATITFQHVAIFVKRCCDNIYTPSTLIFSSGSYQYLCFGIWQSLRYRNSPTRLFFLCQNPVYLFL